MTIDSQDLLNLITEIKQAKQQLGKVTDHKEQVMNQYKQAVDSADQAEHEYMNLMRVLEYCMDHDCDPAYAKLTLSDTQNSQTNNTQSRGSKIMGLPSAGYRKAESLALSHKQPSASRTFKQKMVDWMLKP
jgi:hypothetical protein